MLWFEHVTTGSCLLAPAGGTVLGSCGILGGGAWRKEQVAGEDVYPYFCSVSLLPGLLPVGYSLLHALPSMK